MTAVTEPTANARPAGDSRGLRAPAEARQAPRAYSEAQERVDLDARNAVLDLLVAQFNLAVEADPGIEGPLRARLSRLSPLEPAPVRGSDGAVAPAPSSDAAPKPPATTEPEASFAGASESLLGASGSAGLSPTLGKPALDVRRPEARDAQGWTDIDRAIRFASLREFLNRHARALRIGANRDAVLAHAAFVDAELAALRCSRESPSSAEGHEPRANGEAAPPGARLAREGN